MQIALVAYDHFTDIDLFLAWDLLNRVRTTHWSVRIVADQEFVTSSTGVMIATHGGLHLANAADAVVFVSGSGARALLDDQAWLSKLRLDPSRQFIGSVCSGSLLLAALGVLRPKARATTYPTATETLRELGVEVVEEPFVVNGRVATAAGCSAGVLLACWVISNLAGEAWAERVERSIRPRGSHDPSPCVGLATHADHHFGSRGACP